MRKSILIFIPLVIFLFLLISCSNNITYVTYKYICDEGGSIYGELEQIVEKGSNLSQVYAEADTGYIFVGWSDGLTKAVRNDIDVESDQTINAIFEKIEYVTYKYTCDEGGSIYGELEQTVEKGSNLSQVYAEADTGYRFVSWSDGLTKAVRNDSNVESDQTINAIFEKIEYVTYKYTCDEGGSIYGELEQTVEKGSNLSQVYAEADTGYRFVSWSDGVTKVVRNDSNVESDQTINAIFEKIMVYFYSDETIVREYSLNDLMELDLNKLVGYKSGYTFLGWDFYSTSFNLFGSCDNALDKITYLNGIGYKFKDDINLNAMYQKNGDTSADDSYIVMHGTGGLNGKTYLNSLESFLYWYNKGQRFFEFDIGMTTDGYFLSVHRQFNKTLIEFKEEYKEKGYTILEFSITDK